MKKLIIFTLALFLINISTYTKSFKENQRRYKRVRKAFENKEDKILDLLKKNKINVSNLEVFIRAFKYDEDLELWGKNKEDKKFKLLKTYKFTGNSGLLGPKREQGDLQIPEGFYFIDRFNPVSSFHLSLGLNYPNKSDRILGNRKRLGGDIFIHGSSVTIGCIPIGDELIEELYLFMLLAKNNKQEKIPVHIYPTYMTIKNMIEVLDNEEFKNFWNDLKIIYDDFEKTKTFKKIKVEKKGRYKLN